jgi:hypothetical protein
MKRMGIIFGALVLVFPWPVFSWAQVDLWHAENYNLELEGRYWKPKLDSTVKIVDNNIGTDVNLVNDLGLEERKDFGEGRLQIKFFNHNKFNFSYLPLKWDADQVLTRTIQFEGKTYAAGTRVQSDLDLKLFKAGYEFDFLAGKQGFLGLTFDVLVADTNIQLRAASLAIDEKYGKTLPIPMIGVSGRLNLVKWMGFTAKVSGLPAGGYGYLLDAEGSLDINPVKYVGISGGYRFFKAKASYNDNRADYQLDGPFAALKIRF